MTFAKSLKTLSFTCVAAAVIGLGMGNAMADQMFDFTFSGTGASGNGTFTTGDVGSPFSLTAITGTANAMSITGLSSGPSAYGSADNMLFYPDPGNAGYLDSYGVSFTTDGGPTFNLFSYNGQYGLVDSISNPGGYLDPHTNIDFSVSQVPEPASFALLGLGLLGFAAARRKSAK